MIPKRPLSELVNIDRNAVQPESIADGARYVGLDCIETGGRILRVDEVSAGELASSKFAFDDRHILFGKLRPNLAKVARPDFSGICSTDILPIRPRSDVDRDYLAHYLLSPEVVAWATSRTSGANLPRLSPTVLGTLPVPLPPLPEQRRIASILDQAATIAALRNGAVEVIDAMTGSVFNERFAQLDGPAIRLEELLVDKKDAIRTGPFGSQMLVEEFVDEGVQVLGIDNVRDNVFAGGSNRHITPQKYRELERYTVLPGDVLITIMGTVGRVCVVPEGIPLSISSKHLCALTLRRDQVLPEYIQAYVLNHPRSRLHLNQSQKGAIMAGLNMSIIKDLPVIVPSLSDQNRFVADLATVGAIREQAMLHQDQIRLLTGSLATRAFKGEL